jgi:dihydroflavonol-4-reductase
MRRTAVKVVVLGATGHIGNAIVRELLAQGYEVTVTSRRKEPAANLLGLPVRYESGNSDTPGQLDAWIAGHDLVVDAAAPYSVFRFGATPPTESHALAAATQRTDAVLNAVRQHKARLAYVSSFITLSRPRSGLEGWRAQLVRSLHPYFATKELIEARVLAAAQSGVPAIVVNPTLCLGPWDMKEREFCFIPRLLCGEMSAVVQHILNVIDVRDVATGLLAMVNAERYGEPILLSGHNISTSMLFPWVCEIGGVRPPRLFAPATLSLLASYWTEFVLAQFGQRTPLPSLAIMLACEHEWMAPDATQRELGVTLRPLSETLRDAITWYRGIGYC